MKKVRLLFLLSAFIMSITAFAQSSGTVTDENGDPIIGASVIESGNAKNGTVTDIDGQKTTRCSATWSLSATVCRRRAW